MIQSPLQLTRKRSPSTANIDSFMPHPHSPQSPFTLVPLFVPSSFQSSIQTARSSNLSSTGRDARHYFGAHSPCNGSKCVPRPHLPKHRSNAMHHSGDRNACSGMSCLTDHGARTRTSSSCRRSLWCHSQTRRYRTHQCWMRCCTCCYCCCHCRSCCCCRRGGRRTWSRRWCCQRGGRVC